MGAFCHVLLFRGRGREGGLVGAWLCLWWVKPSTCPMVEDEWLPTTRSKRNAHGRRQGIVRKWFIFSITSPRMISLLCVSGQSLRWQRSRSAESRCGTCATGHSPSRIAEKSHYRNRVVTNHFLELTWVTFAGRNTSSGEWCPSFF